MSQEKTIAEKLKESKGNERIYFSKEDKKQWMKSNYEHEKDLSKKIEDLKYFIYGILVGILGSYISTIIYDLFKETKYFILVNIFILGIFIFIIQKLYFRLSDNKDFLKSSKGQFKIWKNADSIYVGEPFGCLDKKEFKALKKNLKGKNPEEQERLTKEAFQPRQKSI